jgi:hypothetical protein
MAEIQASVKYSEGLSGAETRAHNRDAELSVFGSQNYAFGREPEYWVYLYNISEQTHLVSRPPLIKEMKIVGRKPKEDYALVAKFPQPLNIPKGNVDSGEVDFVIQDTRRFATDIINPDNHGINQDAFIERSTSGGSNDLGAKGVFWSLNGPGASKHGYLEAPTQQEIEGARKRLEKRYRDILNKAKAVETSNPKGLEDVLSPEHHMAADYFGETYSWHNQQVRADYCKLCGERIRAGAAFHVTQDGGLCVNDWDRAIKAGRVSRAMAYDATEDEKYAPKTPVASKE